MKEKPYDYYYRHNKIFLTLTGLWPFQTTISKYFFTIFTIVSGGSQIFLQTGGMISALSRDTDVFLESVAPVVVNGIVLPKFINFLYNKNKMTMLYNNIKQDWHNFMNKEEVKILRIYAKKTERKSLIYAGCVYGGLSPVILLPTIPAVLEIFGLVNQTGPKIMPFPVQYLVDIDKYYYHVIFDAFMGTFSLVMIVVSVDTWFVLYLYHACSIFKIIGYRLNNIVKEIESDYVNASLENDIPYQRIRNCIKLHSKTLRFVKLIEDTHTKSFLAQLGFNVAGITFTGFQAVMLLNKPGESFRYLTFTFAQLSHLYYQSSPPQKLYDYSIEICNDANNGKWYRSSNRTRKLLAMLMMRTLKPCRITAGKFFTLNIHNFGSVVRTSMSYFTVLSSQREID